MDRKAETDADRNLGRKSDDSSKFYNSFWKVDVFLLQYDHFVLSDVGSLSGDVFLRQKSMTAKFDVGGQKR